MNRAILLGTATLAFLGTAAAMLFSPRSEAPEPTREAEPQARFERQNPVPVGTVTAATLVAAQSKGREIISLGGGCFWCIEDDLRRTKGVLATEVGYQGGSTTNPTYKLVGTGTTGHVEVVKVEFDPKILPLDRLLRRFFSVHNPTQGDREGPDFGPQYRSAVFYYSPAQRQAAQKVMADEEKRLGIRLTTRLEDARPFWRAEEYHQQYYHKQGIQKDGAE
jgi:methionine-S-sulfoxide reductase